MIRLMALLPDGMSEADSRTIMSDGEPTKEERGAAAKLETPASRAAPTAVGACSRPIRETLLAEFPPEAEDQGAAGEPLSSRARCSGARAGTDKWSEVREEVTAEAGNIDAMIGVAAREPELPEASGGLHAGLTELHRFTGLASCASLPAVATADCTTQATCSARPIASESRRRRL